MLGCHADAKKPPEGGVAVGGDLQPIEGRVSRV